MKVVQINTVSGTGSVGRIAADLYQINKKAGNKPYIAFGRGEADSLLDTYKIGNGRDFIGHVIKNFFRGEGGFGSIKQTEIFLKWLDEIKPDLIHLHNIHGFYLQVETLFSYIKEKNIPVVWTFHDCWPFTGHCAYFDYANCGKWSTSEGCHQCPIHRSAYPYALFKDNSKSAFFRKKECFVGVKNLTIVTPSKWLAELVRKSFLKAYPIKVIYNGIDLKTFVCKQQAETEKVILGVANIWEKRKGLNYFEKLAKHLPKGYRICLVGVNEKQKRTLLRKFPNGAIEPVTRTENTEQLAELYRKAVVYVNATLEDNFPTTNIEALASGTPVITFATGGSPEAVNSSCGIVAKQGDFDALLAACKHVIDVLEGGTKQYLYSPKACRARAVIFDKNERFYEYIKLYNKMLGITD